MFKKPMAKRISNKADLKQIQDMRREKTDLFFRRVTRQRSIAPMRKRISAFAKFAHYKLCEEVVLP
jgi:hypothetical protein